MDKPILLSSVYVLSAIQKNGDRVFYDTDSHSGGWPYWSPSSRKAFSTLEKIPTFAPSDYMRRAVVTLEVLKVEEIATVVSTSEVVSEAVAKAELEIAKIREELDRKVAALKAMTVDK